MVDAGYSFYPKNFLGGRHEFKTGVMYYYDHEAWYYPGNKNYGNYIRVFDRVGGVSGTPVQIQVANDPVRPSNMEQTLAWYLKDSYRVNDRTTLNLGVRAEYQHAYLPEQTKEASQEFPTVFPDGTFPYVNLVKWFTVVPRVGLAWDGRRLGVFKTTAGLYGYMFGSQRGANYNPNAGAYATFNWRDLNGDKQYQPGESNLNLNGAGSDFVSVSGGISNFVDPDLKQPSTLEYTRQLRARADERHGIPDVVRLQAPEEPVQHDRDRTCCVRSACTTFPITRRDPGPDGVLDTSDDGGKVTFYDYDPAYRGASFVKTVTVNSPNTDKYHTVEFTVIKRPSHGWQGEASFWTVKNDRWLTQTFNAPQDFLLCDRQDVDVGCQLQRELSPAVRCARCIVHAVQARSEGTADKPLPNGRSRRRHTHQPAEHGDASHGRIRVCAGSCAQRDEPALQQGFSDRRKPACGS